MSIYKQMIKASNNVANICHKFQLLVAHSPFHIRGHLLAALVQGSSLWFSYNIFV